MSCKSIPPAATSTRRGILVALATSVVIAAGWLARGSAQSDAPAPVADSGNPLTDPLLINANRNLMQGRNIFRFDTFGDQDFWGGKLRLHQAIEGARLGGVGNGISPNTALQLGLKVDLGALPASVLTALEHKQVNLDDPATTLALLKVNAVVGLKGFFSGSQLQSVGITCALCHSTVDNRLAFGIGRRLDGWANRDLDVGQIIAAAPDLSPLTSLLGVDRAAMETVLKSWGPGKFDAEIFLDGKTFNTRQVTDGVANPHKVPGATLIPNAFGLAGFNQHTWTGAWGTIPYWNALVAVLEMHGKGRFHDPRLNDPGRFPIAAANGFGDVSDISPDDDQVTSKLGTLQFYQLALAVPTPQPGRDFDPAAAKRGDELFSGKAKCNSCHAEPLWTDPGWNLHKPQEIGIDSFEADRAPDGLYKTMNLSGIFVREEGLNMRPANKGRFYHDGRFATLMDVVNHYNKHLHLGLTTQEKSDLVEYLKSLPASASGGGS